VAFEKGRKKTGGRVKGGSLKNSKRFVDQLQRYGFNFTKELAKGLIALPPAARFEELKRLMPYLVPKLKEIEPIYDDASDAEQDISTEALMEALERGKRGNKPAKPATNSVPVVEAGSPPVQTEGRTEGNLPEVAGEQGPS